MYYRIYFTQSAHPEIHSIEPLPGLKDGYIMHGPLAHEDPVYNGCYFLEHKSKTKKPDFLFPWEVIPFHWDPDVYGHGAPMHSAAKRNYGRLDKMEQAQAIARWRSAFKRLVYEFSEGTMNEFTKAVNTSIAQGKSLGKGDPWDSIFSNGKVHAVDQASAAMSTDLDVQHAESKLRVSNGTPRAIMPDGGKGINRAVFDRQYQEWIDSDISSGHFCIEDGVQVFFKIAMQLEGYDTRILRPRLNWPYKHVASPQFLSSLEKARERREISGHTYTRHLIRGDWDKQQQEILAEIEKEKELKIAELQIEAEIEQERQRLFPEPSNNNEDDTDEGQDEE